MGGFYKDMREYRDGHAMKQSIFGKNRKIKAERCSILDTRYLIFDAGFWMRETADRRPETEKINSIWDFIRDTIVFC